LRETCKRLGGAAYEVSESHRGTLAPGISRAIDCDGTDDDAEVVLRVRKVDADAPRGDSYDLRLTVYSQ